MRKLTYLIAILLVSALALSGCCAQEVQEPASEKILNLDEMENLSAALDMMVTYAVFYDRLKSNPGKEFWEPFASAVLCNSWFGPFSDWGSPMTNDLISAAGKLATGQDITCDLFPEGLDVAGGSYSPYLFDSAKLNLKMTPSENNGYTGSYLMMWMPTSLTQISGMKRVNFTIEPNEESPFDGYSITSLQAEPLYYPIEGDYEIRLEQTGDATKDSYDLYVAWDGTESLCALNVVHEQAAGQDSYYICTDNSNGEAAITAEEYEIMVSKLLEQTGN